MLIRFKVLNRSIEAEHQPIAKAQPTFKGLMAYMQGYEVVKPFGAFF